jgi:hypothetical protein
VEIVILPDTAAHSVRLPSRVRLCGAIASAAPIKKVFVIAMENHSWTQPANQFTGTIQQICQNPNASFINGLVNGTVAVVINGQIVNVRSQTAYATAYHNVLATPSENNPHIHPSQVREEVRGIWLTRWLRDFVYDLRFSTRSFLRSPSFTATSVLSLALGIGATTAIYSLVDQVVLHALPVDHLERLVLIDWHGEHWPGPSALTT